MKNLIREKIREVLTESKMGDLMRKIDDEHGSLIFKPYNEAKKILVDNGFTVISQSKVKSTYMEYVKDRETATKLAAYYPNTTKDVDPNIKQIYDIFEGIVLKDKRGNSTQWSNLNSYLTWRSELVYKWFSRF